MVKKRVFVTRDLPGEAINNLRKNYDVGLNTEDRVLTQEELLEGIRGCHGVLCLLTDRMDGEAMDASDSLEVISNYTVGFDNIDTEAATERGIYVCNTPGVLTETVADFAWVLIFAVSRRGWVGLVCGSAQHLFQHLDGEVRPSGQLNDTPFPFDQLVSGLNNVSDSVLRNQDDAVLVDVNQVARMDSQFIPNISLT